MTGAIEAVRGLILWLSGAVAAAIGAAEGALRRRPGGLGVPVDLRELVLVAAFVALALLALRVLGRVAAGLILVLLVLLLARALLRDFGAAG